MYQTWKGLIEGQDGEDHIKSGVPKRAEHQVMMDNRRAMGIQTVL